MKHFAIPVVMASCALVALRVCAPLYLTHQGFPLDDAWIHAVYARELAQSGLLAFNPGIAATGETSPLWALLLAPLHLAGQPSTAVLLTKAFGVALHAASVVLLALAIRRADHDARALSWACAGLAAIHPDLVAASVSGMEVPLAALLIAAVALASVRSATTWLFALGTACFLGRPESASVAILFPLILWGRREPRRALRLSAAACGGVALALFVTGAFNIAVWGRPLPATFYAKAALTNQVSGSWQALGFRAVLGAMPLASPLVLAVAAVLSTAVAARRQSGAGERLAASLLLSGLAFFVVSFALVHPTDPFAFYHQRYVVPALLPIVVALPLLLWGALGALRVPRRSVLQAVVCAGLAVALALASPARYRRLQNDAQNVDDVQVAMGRALAGAPPSANVWAVDAGAVRFFGSAFVVDLVGLNTPEMLTPAAQAFLDRHPPAYVDLFPTWSTVETDEGTPLARQAFVTSTDYTVTGVPIMRQHSLVTCRPGASGRVTLRQRTFTFRCAS